MNELEAPFHCRLEVPSDRQEVMTFIDQYEFCTLEGLARPYGEFHGDCTVIHPVGDHGRARDFCGRQWCQRVFVVYVVAEPCSP